MQTGSLVVSLIVSPTATWSSLILLLAVHLGMNHAAVRAVHMDNLNRQRANILFSHMLHENDSEPTVLTPSDVAAKERIFEQDGVLRWRCGPAIGGAIIGTSLQTLLSALNTTSINPSGNTATLASSSNAMSLDDLLDVFQSEDHILWPSYPLPATIHIVLKQGASPVSQLKAWAHALLIARELQLDAERGGNLSRRSNREVLRTVREMLTRLEERWQGDVGAMRAKGWDLDVASLETWEGTRVRVEE